MSFELNFDELQKKLKRIINPSRFRFIIILYPNTNMIDEIKNHISEIYPKSLVTNLNLKDKTYQDITTDLYKNNEGFVYINDFDEILNNANLYNGFNQRRDKIASHNINLICFISIYKKDELFKKVLDVIPDLWEFKNTVLELEKDETSDNISEIKTIESSAYSSFGGLTSKEKNIELKKLLKRLEDTSNDELKSNLLYQITTIFKDLGDYKNCMKYLKQEFYLKQNLFGKDSLESATNYNNISMIYQKMGDQKQALDYQNKALKLQEKILDNKHPYLATSYSNISNIYETMGELKQALEYQNKALKLREKILGNKHPDLASSYSNMSAIYKTMGELKQALEYQNKALELRKKILRDKHPDLAVSYSHMSSIYKAMGDLKQALYYQNKALELYEEILGDKHPDLAIPYANIAQIYMQYSNIENAKKYIKKSMNILSKTFPNGHPNLSKVLKIQEHINLLK